jgi:catechol 2,3-dioxygenase
MPARNGPRLSSAAHSASKTRVNALMALRSIRGTVPFERRNIMPDNPNPIVAGTRIGHVHLKVADLDRALGFYCGVLGFELTQRMGSDAAFISAGGYHHHIGLNTWESKGGHPPAQGTTGLFHTAILYPTRPALADALYRVLQAGIHLDGASDHGVSEALYLRDPDENGVELYCDRPKQQWPRKPDGSLAMFTHRLDLDDLLRQRVA